MSLRPYKFIISPVVQQLDDEGDVVGERTLSGTDDAGNPQPIVLYGCEQLVEWAQTFPDALAEQEKKS
jgi:hypothetical protein